MAKKTKDNVMQMVERRLEKEPDVDTSTLYEEAKKVDSSVGKLSIRQFHARYPLQVKRRKAAAEGRGRRRAPRRRTRRKKEELNRTAVRESLLRFAQDISAAEGKAELIDVLAGLDRYVEEIASAVDGGGR